MVLVVGAVLLRYGWVKGIGVWVRGIGVWVKGIGEGRWGMGEGYGV